MPTLHLVRPPAAPHPPPRGQRHAAAAADHVQAFTGDADLLRLRDRLRRQPRNPGDAPDAVVVLGPAHAADALDTLGVPWAACVCPPADAVWAVAPRLRAIAREHRCDRVAIHGDALADRLARLPRLLGIQRAPAGDLHDAIDAVEPGPHLDESMHQTRADGDPALVLAIDQPASVVDCRRLAFLCGLMTVAGVPARAVVHASASRLPAARRFAHTSRIPLPATSTQPIASILNHADVLISDPALVRDPRRHDPRSAEQLASLSRVPACLGHTLDWSALGTNEPTARLPRLAGALLEALAAKNPEATKATTA